MTRASMLKRIEEEPKKRNVRTPRFTHNHHKTVHNWKGMEEV